MTYRHGVYISEVPTSIVPPARASAGLPVVFGTAPVNLATDPAPPNTPVLCFTYGEAVRRFGSSSDWGNYTLCEFIKSHFALFAVAPVVLINVLDSENAAHMETVASEAATLIGGAVTLPAAGIFLDTLTVRVGEVLCDVDVDYTAAFDADGKVVITRIATSEKIASDTAALTVGYTKLKPSGVAGDDIVGGIDALTGAYTGLELVNRVFPLFRLVPGQILAPGWSTNPAVAAVMVAKASNINGHFRCIALTDVPTDEADDYTEVAAWKNDNNYTAERQVACWPKVKLGDEQFHLSTQLAGVICKADAENDDIPFRSPSNKSLQADGAVLVDEAEISLGPDQAAYLNGQGIVTALNFIGGWKVWGNRTAAYPSVTDPKDVFIPIRRMFDWIGNTLVLSFWQKVDFPANRRLVETVVDSANIWLNGLAARGFILGGRVEFLPEENPETDLMDGIYRFHVYATPPAPAREIDFIVEYDPAYLATLFGGD